MAACPALTTLVDPAWVGPWTLWQDRVAGGRMEGYLLGAWLQDKWPRDLTALAWVPTWVGCLHRWPRACVPRLAWTGNPRIQPQAACTTAHPTQYTGSILEQNMCHTQRCPIIWCTFEPGWLQSLLCWYYCYVQNNPNIWLVVVLWLPHPIDEMRICAMTAI